MCFFKGHRHIWKNLFIVSLRQYIFKTSYFLSIDKRLLNQIFPCHVYKKHQSLNKLKYSEYNILSYP